MSCFDCRVVIADTHRYENGFQVAYVLGFRGIEVLRAPVLDDRSNAADDGREALALREPP